MNELSLSLNYTPSFLLGLIMYLLFKDNFNKTCDYWVNRPKHSTCIYNSIYLEILKFFSMYNMYIVQSKVGITKNKEVKKKTNIENV